MARFGLLQYSNDFSDLMGKLVSMERTLEGPALADFLNTEIYPYLRQKALARWSNYGSDIGPRWPELRESTQQRRMYYGDGPSGPINYRTGGLEDYIQAAHPAVRVAPGEATLVYPGDQPDDYATQRKYKTAQQGKKATRTPPRPVIGLAPEDYVFIREKLEQFIMTRGAS